MILAILVGLISLFVSNRLVKELSEEERKSMEVWALATEILATELDVSYDVVDMSLVLRILESNSTIPIILYDERTGHMMGHNLEIPAKNADIFLEKKIKSYKQKHAPIVLQEVNQLIYYGDSLLLRQLQWYPYLQLLVISLFIALAFLALNRSRRAEQNRVWIGLSKETAHQLGTPISSLMAWLEYLKLKDVDPILLNDIDKDILRLQIIAERFSKIGSKSDLQETDLCEALTSSLDYMEKRVSHEVTFQTVMPNHSVIVNLNKPLFDWVVENLVKNGIDAMKGQGNILFTITEKHNQVVLDISDSGKGLVKSKYKTIFHPGYTTKERGWGLGLALVKRIIVENHGGDIFVKQSELDKGTTIRIVLGKC